MEQKVATLKPAMPAVGGEHTTNIGELLFNPKAMEMINEAAKQMASGRITTPKHFQGNVGDCAAVIMQAMVWGMIPHQVASKTHVTQGGQLGYEAQLINAIVTSRAPIKGRPKFEFIGDWNKILGKVKECTGKSGGKYYQSDWKAVDEEGLGVVVSCTLRGEDEPRIVKVMLKQCWPRFSTQWATDPQQQITYTALQKWARRNTPDVILGVYTPEELEEAPMRDMGDAQVVNSVDDLLGEKEQTKAPAGPSQADIDGCVKAFASINVTKPMICAYASLQRVEDMSAEDLQKLRNAYGEITKNKKPLSYFFKVEKPAEDIDDAVMAVTEDQLVLMINDADSIESLDDIQALLEGLDSDEARERVAGMIGARRSEFD